jgi:hypothetical protein
MNIDLRTIVRDRQQRRLADAARVRLLRDLARKR